jgi:hypothetical protein
MLLKKSFLNCIEKISIVFKMLLSKTKQNTRHTPGINAPFFCPKALPPQDILKYFNRDALKILCAENKKVC